MQHTQVYRGVCRYVVIDRHGRIVLDHRGRVTRQLTVPEGGGVLITDDTLGYITAAPPTHLKCVSDVPSRAHVLN